MAQASPITIPLIIWDKPIWSETVFKTFATVTTITNKNMLFVFFITRPPFSRVACSTGSQDHSQVFCYIGDTTNLLAFEPHKHI